MEIDFTKKDWNWEIKDESRKLDIESSLFYELTNLMFSGYLDNWGQSYCVLLPLPSALLHPQREHTES